MYHRLREIPGIGEKIAERILDHFSTEEEALRVIENFELEKLLNLNLPYKKLVELVRYGYSKKFGFEYVNLCKTREAREIYARIIELTKKFAVTDYAKLKMHIFYPTKDIKELKRRFEIIENAKVPCSPINDIDDVMKHKQILARNMIIDVDDKQAGKIKIAGNPIKMCSIPEVKERKPAPDIGEHNNEIYGTMLGFSDDEIAKLQKDGII